MVNIVTDSTADLGAELAAHHGVTVVPFPVHHGEQTYHDGVDIDATKLYRLVEESGRLPKTSAPPIPDYIAAFDRPGEVIFTGLSSALSAGFQHARMAAEQFPPGKVRLIDSRNLSTGTGLLVLRAADRRDQGCLADEIERELLALVPKVRTSMVLDTLRYVHMGGRCTAVQSIVGSLLQIRPWIAVNPDGSLDVRQKLRGTRRRALQVMVDDFAAHLSEIDLRRVFVSHSGSEDVEWVADQVRRIASPDDLLITQAGSTICTHCGPNTTGILYMVK